MEAIIAILIEQATLWMPSIVAVIGVIVGILKGVGSLKDAIHEVKDEKAFNDIRAELEKQHADLLREHGDNIILKKQLQEVINQLSHVQDYHKERFDEMEGENNETPNE